MIWHVGWDNCDTFLSWPAVPLFLSLVVHSFVMLGGATMTLSCHGQMYFFFGGTFVCHVGVIRWLEVGRFLAFRWFSPLLWETASLLGSLEQRSKSPQFSDSKDAAIM